MRLRKSTSLRLELSKGGTGDGIMYIAPFHNLENSVSDDIKHRLEQLMLQILEGTITVPERIITLLIAVVLLKFSISYIYI
jgi:hypothetical protein